MKPPTDWDELHDVKGLAAALKKSRGYVADMQSAGFVMIADRASLRMAMGWLGLHPEFTRRHAAALRFARRAASREQMGTPGNTGGLASPPPK